MKVTDELLNQAKNLDGCDILFTLTRAQIEKAYNGIGADWMPQWSREALDGFCAEMLPAALLHDCQYAYETDRTTAKREECDTLFYENCLALVDEAYAWYNIKRYSHRRIAKRFYEALKIGGGMAWNAGVIDKQTE